MIATSALTTCPPARARSFRFAFLLNGPWLETGPERHLITTTRTGSLIGDICEVLEQLKADAVYLRDVEELQDCFEKFPGVVDVLVEAVRLVKEHLPEAKLFLSMYRDRR